MPTIAREKMLQTISRNLSKMDDAEIRAIAMVTHHIVKDKWRLRPEKKPATK